MYKVLSGCSYLVSTRSGVTITAKVLEYCKILLVMAVLQVEEHDPFSQDGK